MLLQLYAVSLTACLSAANCPFPGQQLDNCMNNTGTVGDSLQVHSVDTQVGCLVVRQSLPMLG